jgi:hypothetical protein
MRELSVNEMALVSGGLQMIDDDPAGGAFSLSLSVISSSGQQVISSNVGTAIQLAGWLFGINPAITGTLQTAIDLVNGLANVLGLGGSFSVVNLANNLQLQLQGTQP